MGVLGLRLGAPAALAEIEDPLEDAPETYRPSRLESFNENMFDFNFWLDEHVLRPVATAYDRALPDAAQRGLDRFFRNLGVVPRLANNLFQLKLTGAGREASRFVLNSTLGGVGLFDVAGSWFDLKESNEDFGQTLGSYGIRPGPYLVLPFLGSSTVRDTLGSAVDGAMNPMNYLLSSTEQLAIESGTTTGRLVNFRSLHLELFEDVDRFALDLYSAVQDFYLQKREQEVAE
jgi:phospholipid-binding lipoprotein MlaA